MSQQAYEIKWKNQSFPLWGGSAKADLNTCPRQVTSEQVLLSYKRFQIGWKIKGKEKKKRTIEFIRKLTD